MVKIHERFGPPLLTILVFLVGILNLVSAVQPSLPDRFHQLKEILPLVLIHSSRHIVALLGFLLILIAGGIRRRKKVAWWFSFALMLASILFNMLKGLDYEEAIIISAVIGIMLFLYPSFTARSDMPIIKKALRMLAAVVLINIAYGVMGFYLLHKPLGIYPSFYVYLTDTFREMFSLSIPNFYITNHHARWFINSLWLMWETGLLLVVIMFLRPVVYRYTTRISDLEKAKTIAKNHGRSSLIYFTLWEDKMLFINRESTCYIAYRQVGDIAVVLGDPVGPKEGLNGIIEEFIKYCDGNGWYPTFYQVLPDNLDLYEKFKLNKLFIGSEAVVELDSFDMSGKRWKQLRNTLSRFDRQGFKVVWHQPPLDADTVQKAKVISQEWLYYQGGDEKAFSLGWFSDEKIKENHLLTVEKENGKVYAFANFVPMYHLSQGSPDMMRFSRDTPNGIMDFLFLNAILYFKEKGLQGLNLGLAPLSQAGKEETSFFADKAVRYLYENFYNFKGLYEFKAKYSPRWEPRFLI
ncbi:MAG: phosphatidylglycerol lysyltransferase domain-containing protein, partial [Desulfitobacterium hafniense]|nr:phosphatidylglycerol lysyltransferase domain-containing protein [Desulfitobacterium hafniense]